MRKWLCLIAVLGLIGTTACKRSSSDSSTTNGVVSTLNTNCLNSTINTTNGLCNNNININSTNGLRNYPVSNGYYQGYYNNYSQGFVGCNFNEVPVTHDNVGVFCLNKDVLLAMIARYQHYHQPIQPAYWNWQPEYYEFTTYEWVDYSYFQNDYSYNQYGSLGFCNTTYTYSMNGFCAPINDYDHDNFGGSSAGIWFGGDGFNYSSFQQNNIELEFGFQFN